MASLNKLEVGTTLFSDSLFDWRRLNIGHFECRDSLPESTVRGGVFHYRQGPGQPSAHPSSHCRNRSIIWRHDDHMLYLHEISLDHDLSNNTLQLTISSSLGPLLTSSLTIHELSAHLVILFQSSSTVFRLVLPHPDAILKDPKLSSAGKGLHPSVLTFAREDSFSGTNMAAAFSSSDHAPPPAVCSSSSWTSGSGEAVFVYGLTSSESIHCVKLPPPGTSGMPERFDMSSSSMVKRFWNLLPTGIRGSDDDSNCPVSMSVHSFSGELIVLVLCKNATLRLWSVQQKECVMEHSLVEYLPPDASVKDAKLAIFNSSFSSTDSLNFAVFFGLSVAPQVSVFQLLLIESQLVLDLIISHSLPVGHVLTDLSLGPDSWWTVSTVNNTYVLNYCCYGDRINPSIKNVSTKALPLSDVMLNDSKDPRETYLEQLFLVDKFSSESISRALKLYGSSVDWGLTNERLREGVVSKVEEEIMLAARSCEMSHDDYRELVIKCWNKFYTCCLQYEKLVRTPVGLSHNPQTGLVTLVQQGTMSFVLSKTDHTQQCDVSGIINQTIQFLHQHVPCDVLELFLSELYQNDPLSIVEEIIKQLVATDDYNVIEKELIQLLSEATPTIFMDLANLLNPTEETSAMATEGGVAETDMSLTDLLSSSFSCRLMSGAIGDLSHDRMGVCRDVLIILSIMKRHCIISSFTISDISELVFRFANLLKNYHVLYWMATEITTPSNQSTIDANLRMLSNLKLSENVPMMYFVRRSGCDASLMELFVSTYGRGHLIRLLQDSPPLQGDMFPWLLSRLIGYCWPEKMFLTIYQFLLTEGHYMSLQVLNDLMSSMESVENGYLMPNSREFLLGQSHLSSGEPNKALYCFIKAFGGLEKEPLLMKVAEVEGGYWTVCMRLFEESSALEALVQLLEHATTVMDEKDAVMPLLWSNLFKYSLELELHERAYYAMLNNPDKERSRECLKHFIVVLTERKLLKELCDFTYCGLEEEVEHVMELRARSVEVFDEHRYYDLMYCYYMSREKYWRASHVMYEYGLRCGLEGSSVGHIEQQCNCYVACLTCLKLVKPKYHWIVVPKEQDTAKKSNGVRILKLKDIEIQYQLVLSKLVLLKRFPVLSSQLCSPYVSADELQTLLCQNGLFDEALKLSKKSNLSLTPVCESLAGKCALLCINSSLISDDPSLWEWITFNDSASNVTGSQSSIIDQAWNMLHCYLKKLPKDYLLLQSVMRKLLSLGCNPPQWLIEIAKVTDPARLLRLYMEYSLLEQAMELVIEYVDAVMGCGSEYFGLKNALHVSSSSVWLPYTQIDQLINIDCGVDPSLNKLKDCMMKKLDEYLQLVEKISEESKQVAMLSYYH